MYGRYDGRQRRMCRFQWAWAWCVMKMSQGVCCRKRLTQHSRRRSYYRQSHFLFLTALSLLDPPSSSFRVLLIPFTLFVLWDGLPGTNAVGTVVNVLLENGVVPDPLPSIAFPRVKLVVREWALGVEGASVAGGVGASVIAGTPMSNSGYFCCIVARTTRYPAWTSPKRFVFLVYIRSTCSAKYWGIKFE